MKRVFLIVIDSCGIGALPDAKLWNDESSNTLRAIRNSKHFFCPKLKELGLFNIDTVGGGIESPKASFARMGELSNGKDTTVGHWEIAGIICGTVAGVMYGLIGADIFLPQLMWIGISVSLLSQYGDLTASWIKRKMNIKDFGTILPGHGGVLDRFDGWIYALPLVWLIML